MDSTDEQQTWWEKWSRWVWVGVAFVLLLVLGYFALFHSPSVPWFKTRSAAIQGVSTVALVVVTIWYVGVTWRLARHSKEAAKAAKLSVQLAAAETRPVVVVELGDRRAIPMVSFGGGSTVSTAPEETEHELKVLNIGRTPAFNVNVSVEVRRQGGVSKYRMKVITYIKAGADRTPFWANRDQAESFIPTGQGDDRYQIEYVVSYLDAGGNKLIWSQRHDWTVLEIINPVTGRPEVVIPPPIAVQTKAARLNMSRQASDEEDGSSVT